MKIDSIPTREEYLRAILITTAYECRITLKEAVDHLINVLEKQNHLDGD